MITANDKYGIKVVAKDSRKGEEYNCPICGSPVFPKQGEIKIWHFAHYADPECRFTSWEPESYNHIKMKYMVGEILNKNNQYFLEYEKPIGHHIVDVFLNAENKIAVECQIQNKTLKEMKEKTKAYSDAGIYTLWLFYSDDLLSWKESSENVKNNSPDSEDEYEDDTIFPHYYYEVTVPAMLRQSHYWNYGRLYYLDLYNIFKSVIKIIPLHLGMVTRYNEWCHYFYKLRTKRMCNFGRLYTYNMTYVNRSDGYKIAKFRDNKWW